MFSITAYSQCWSIPFSLLSIILSSVKLYYSQRLGRYPDPDPTLKMTLFAIPFITLLIIGPLFSFVLMATYLQGLLPAVIPRKANMSNLILSLSHLKTILALKTYGGKTIK